MSRDFYSFTDVGVSRAQPAEEVFPITPHATNTLAFVTRGIMANSATTLSFRTINGNSVAGFAVAAGTIYPFVLSHVFSANGVAVWGIR